MKFGRIDNLIVFGGGQRTVNFIAIARKFRFNQILVFSGKRLLESELKLPVECVTLSVYLEKNKIPYFEVDDINIFPIEKYIKTTTLGVSFGAPWIFSSAIINKFHRRLINAHGTNLPRNRGGGGFSWQVMQGQVVGCHLFHLIDESIDSGKIILFDKFLFPKKCRIPKDYYDYFEKTEISLFKKFFKKLVRKENFKEITQYDKESTYFPRLSTQHHGFINWNWKAVEIEKFICAFDAPYAGASSFIDRRRLFLRGARSYYKDGTFHPFMSGLIYRKYNGFLYIAVNDGSILVRNVYDKEGHEISDKIKSGHRFVTPTKYIDSALEYRAVYDTQGLKKFKKSKSKYQ